MAPPLELTKDKFLYGRYYDKNPKFLAEKIMQVLKLLEVEY